MPVGDYSLFIFDWDGTLSTSTFLVRLSRLFQRRYNIDYVKKHFRDYETQDIEKVEMQGEVNRTYAHLYDIYSVFYKPRLQPGVVELLKELRSRKKRIAIFSDSTRYRLMSEVRMLGMSKYVDFVLSADSIDRYKPNPQGLLFIARHFKTQRSRSLYVGDMASDILTARFAKMDICSVGNGVESYRLLKELHPEYIFKDLVEMRSHLNSGRS